MLWVDKHRPRTVDQLDYHTELAASLKAMVARGDFPHMLLYGPPGAGKKTRVLALLREIYGPGVEKVKVEHKQFKVNSTTVEVPILSSPHHLELNPGDAGNRDRDVVQEVIKDIAASAPLPGGAAAGADGAPQWKPFKIIVLNEVDNLTKDAQHALRRTMEKYISTCRIIMTCNNASRVLAPVRSRCLCVRVAAPTTEDVRRVMAATARKEGIALPDGLAGRIAQQARGNLRKALLLLETARVVQLPLTDSQPIKQADWERYVSEIARGIVGEQSPRKLGEVRNKVYDLLAHCVPPDMIMEALTRVLLKSVGDQPELQMEIVALAAQYEHRMLGGTKAIFHIEAFIAKFMAIYKRFLIASFS